MTQYNAQLGFYKATAAELISGVRAVAINSSGNFQIAMANNTNRMPAIGVAPAAILSGTVGKVYNALDVVATISGQVGLAVNVGSSGALTVGTASLLSGYTQQIIGVASTSGAYINV